jgi:hypothetical protein
MVSFGAIFIASAMVVRVFWRVERRICCRVYVMYGTECVGIKVDKLRTIDMTQLLDCYVKGCARMHFCYGRLCPRPPEPMTVGKLKISAFSMSY